MYRPRILARAKTAQLAPGVPASWLAVLRTPSGGLTWRRLLAGGRLSDAGRLPRYAATFLLGSALIWAPILGYLKAARPQFTSNISLILPGSGASASVNLADIGQASSSASSAFSSGSISPTETYKRLIGADRILESAAKALGVSRAALGQPRIRLVDQTGLIHVEITGATPQEARAHGDALVAAFFREVDALRADEMSTREIGGAGAIEDYVASVHDTRRTITELQERSGLMMPAQFGEQVAEADRMAVRLHELEATLENRRGQLEAMEALLEMPAEAAAATLKLYADAPYLALLNDVATQSAALAEAAAHYGPNHPKLLQAQEAHDGATAEVMQRAIEVTGWTAERLSGLDRAPDGARAELLSHLVQLHVELESLTREHATLAARYAAETDRLRKLAPMASALEDLQRDFAVAEAVFASAIARTQSTKTDLYASYPLVQVLENPSLPDHPSSPRRKLAIAAGAAATFMLLVGLAIAWVRLALIGRLLARPESDPPS